MSSADYEETVHKLLKVSGDSRFKCECVSMVIECCSLERSYIGYFGFLAQRLCGISVLIREFFCNAFCRQLKQLHRFSICKLRNLATLYAHLLSTDSIS